MVIGYILGALGLAPVIFELMKLLEPIIVIIAVLFNIEGLRTI